MLMPVLSPRADRNKKEVSGRNHHKLKSCITSNTSVNLSTIINVIMNNGDRPAN